MYILISSATSAIVRFVKCRKNPRSVEYFRGNYSSIVIVNTNQTWFAFLLYISCGFWSFYAILRRIRTASCSFTRFSAESRDFRTVLHGYIEIRARICTNSRGVSFSLRDRVRFHAISPRFSCNFVPYRTILHEKHDRNSRDITLFARFFVHPRFPDFPIRIAYHRVE